MSDRYKPNGRPVTPAERELLELLIEECAEVIQCATKVLRFGRENRPDRSGRMNTEEMALEFGDVVAVAALIGAQDEPMITDDLLQEGVKRKVARLKKYLQCSDLPEGFEKEFG